jgi:hypothetical protein
VSAGLKEVSIEVIDEAGDCDDRNLERNRRRYLRGIGFGIDAHETGRFDFVYAVGTFAA